VGQRDGSSVPLLPKEGIELLWGCCRRNLKVPGFLHRASFFYRNQLKGIVIYFTKIKRS